MGIFSALFDSSQRQWYARLGDSEIPFDTKIVIEKFFIADKIDVNKYQANQAVNELRGLGLEMKFD